MTFLLAALAVVTASGLAALLPWRTRAATTAVAVGGAALGGTLGLVAAGLALVGRPGPALVLPWSVPLGSFAVGLDALSGVFLLAISLLGGLAAVYGAAYMADDRRPAGPHWCFYNLLLAGMMLVVTARHAVTFLVAWEVMSLASFFLVTHEDDRPEVRDAGWTYLVATHLGTACLLAAFLLLGSRGSLALAQPSPLAAPLPRDLASVVFVLAVLGFGAKAGFWPLHVWLPHAHPAAPSHVSAVMSGVMLKTGIYGLLRVLTMLGAPEAWWGWLLLGIGVTSGVLGVLFALAQHDLKRLLAYHSVENIGIIALGLGCGLLGVTHNLAVMAVLGFAGALLHVVNHALFKGLLFLGAGAVAHATGTREIDRLGGLGKRMPVTAGTFLVGAAAISGLPPLNGFVSELLVFLAAFSGLAQGASAVAVPAMAVVAGLGLIGGLAAACFTKAYGVVFLGEPRSAEAGATHDPGPAMRAVMLTLAALCGIVGLGGFLVVPLLASAVARLTHLPPTAVVPVLSGTVRWLLVGVAGVGVVVGLLAAVVLLERARRLARQEVGASPTWDCGYAAPTSRMQYTASSFAEPITSLLHAVLRTHRHGRAPEGFFPTAAALHTETPDVAEVAAWRPAFTAVADACGRLHVLQHGRVQAYVLYIAVALLVLLVWGLW